MEVSDQHHAPVALPLTKSHLSLGGLKIRYEQFGVDKNLLHLPEIEPRSFGRSSTGLAICMLNKHVYRRYQLPLTTNCL
jgi:hypothetical protein